MKNQIRKFCMDSTLLLLTFWAIMSIVGAFRGAERAKIFFNSLPMAIFWCVFLGLLIAGFAFYQSLRRRIGLKLIHMGCCLVVVGGILGSEKGQTLTGKIKSKPFLIKGLMALTEGQSSQQVQVASPEGGAFELPFAIQLKQARIEYYDTAAIRITFKSGAWMTISNKIGQKFPVSDEIGTIEVTKVYQNFKLRRQDGQMVPYEAGPPAENPAYELTLTKPDKTTETQLVFENLVMHRMPNSTFYAEFMPSQMVKDYMSTLQVIKDGHIVKEATIEVNKPLYYGGYHFYQHTFGYDEYGPVSGLMVTSATGVWIVFAGYGLIFCGLIGHFWFGVIAKRLRLNKSQTLEGREGALC